MPAIVVSIALALAVGIPAALQVATTFARVAAAFN